MNNTNKIKIVLVDDHTMMRDALAMMLHQINDFQVVGSVSSGEELLSSLQGFNPDVILMDIVMKNMTGLETTRWIKERNSSTKVIILSSEIKKEFVSTGIQFGIDGYLSKDADKTLLIDAIRTVYKGERYFNEAITKLIFEDYYQKARLATEIQRQSKDSDLTKREVQVLSLIASGRSNKETAEELGISIKTIDTHKMHILDKLGLKNTAELVKYAIKNNLIVL